MTVAESSPLPPPGKTWDDLQRWGTCRVCGVPMFGWSPLPAGDARAKRCGQDDCERPVDLLGPLPVGDGGQALGPYADRAGAAGSAADDDEARRHG